MGVWEEQSKRTAQSKKLWSEAQEFSFIHALQNATNEEEVKAAYIREFSLPVKTQERHDLLVDKVLFEFKYSVRLDDTEVAAKVVAQAIYYVNRLFEKGRLCEVEYLVIADKDEARLFKVSEFKVFYESQKYQWSRFRPSSPDPKLIEAIKNSRILESNRIHKLASKDDLGLFSSCLYKILSCANASKSTKNTSVKFRLLEPRFLITGFGLILFFSSAIFGGSHYYFDHLKHSVPVTRSR